MDASDYVYKIWIVNFRSKIPFKSLQNKYLISSLFNGLIMSGHLVDEDKLKFIFRDTNNHLLERFPVIEDNFYHTFEKLGGIFSITYELYREYLTRVAKFNLRINNKTLIALIHGFAEIVTNKSLTSAIRDIEAMKKYETHCRSQLLFINPQSCEKYNEKYWKLDKPEPGDETLFNYVFDGNNWVTQEDPFIMEFIRMKYDQEELVD